MNFFFLNIFVYCILLLVILNLLGMLLHSFEQDNSYKRSTFECGFNSLTNFCFPFSLRFFSITIIFLMFDIELMVLFPLSYTMSSEILTYNWYLMGGAVMIILMAGLLHEFFYGMLKWII